METTNASFNTMVRIGKYAVLLIVLTGIMDSSPAKPGLGKWSLDASLPAIATAQPQQASGVYQDEDTRKGSKEAEKPKEGTKDGNRGKSRREYRSTPLDYLYSNVA